jgi:hypothetical protein
MRFTGRSVCTSDTPPTRRTRAGRDATSYSPDTDVPLDLQMLIEQCYRNGGYDDDIDYHRAADSPLMPADESWADELLGTQQRR